jgi:beta-glucosidase
MKLKPTTSLPEFRKIFSGRNLGLPFLLLFLIMILLPSCKKKVDTTQVVLGTRSVELLGVDGLQFKDLNKNGKLDRYEDWRLTSDERVADLLGQMTLD